MATSVPNTNTFSLTDVTAVVGGNSLSQTFTNADPDGFDVTYSGSKDRLYNFRNYQHPYNMFAGISTGGIPLVIKNTGQVTAVSGAPAFSIESRPYVRCLPYWDFDPYNNILMYRQGTGSTYAEFVVYSQTATPSRSFTYTGGQTNNMVTFVGDGSTKYWVVTGQSANQARYAIADSAPTTWSNVASLNFPTSGVIRKWSYGNSAWYYTTANGEVGKVTGSLGGSSAYELHDSDIRDFTCLSVTGNKIIAMEDGQEARYAPYTNDYSWSELQPMSSGALVSKMIKYSTSYSLVLNEDLDLFYMNHNSTTPSGVEIAPPFGHWIGDVFVEPGTTNIYALTYYFGNNYIYLKTSIFDSTWDLICQLSSRSITIFKISS